MGTKGKCVKKLSFKDVSQNIKYHFGQFAGFFPVVHLMISCISFFLYCAGFLHSVFLLGATSHIWEMASCMKKFPALNESTYVSFLFVFLCIFLYQQEEVCRTEAQALLKEYPLLMLKARVIQAAQLGREGKLNDAQALLNTCIQEYPQHATEIQLMTVQILLAKVSMNIL